MTLIIFIYNFNKKLKEIKKQIKINKYNEKAVKLLKNLKIVLKIFDYMIIGNYI